MTVTEKLNYNSANDFLNYKVTAKQIQCNDFYLKQFIG